MWADNASKIDMLAYRPYAELMYEISNDERMNPLTIGLFGSWGSGKSTLLSLVNEKISNTKDKKIIAITLNSWMFEGYDDAKTALMEALLRAIKENEEIKEKLKENFVKLIKRVDYIRVGSVLAKKGLPIAMSAITGNPIPALTSIFDGILESVKDMGDAESIMEKVSEAKEEYLNKEVENDESIIENIRRFRSEFEELIDKSKIDNLIIMVDDLDRCNPDRILETLEAIKLFLSVKKTTFIVAIDERVIIYSIKRKYPKLMQEDNLDVSKDYIEKIIQLPIRLPELSEVDIKNYMILLVCELFLSELKLNELLEKLYQEGLFAKGEIINSIDIIKKLEINTENSMSFLRNNYRYDEFQEYLQIFDQIGDVIAGVLKGNPRQAKRFLNTFYIRKRMAEIQRLELNLSVLAKLMVLEYIDKDLFNELYKWQSKNNGIAIELGLIFEMLSQNGNIVDEYSKWNKERIINWIRVEPVNIFEEDLRPYFYLSRESIGENSFVRNYLSHDERIRLDDICGCADNTLRKNLIKDLEILPEDSLDRIIKGTMQNFKYNHELFEALVNIFEFYEKYRELVVEEFKKLNEEDMSMSNVNLLVSLHKKGYQQIDNLKGYLVSQGKLKEEKWNAIERRGM